MIWKLSIISSPSAEGYFAGIPRSSIWHWKDIGRESCLRREHKALIGDYLIQGASYFGAVTVAAEGRILTTRQVIVWLVGAGKTIVFSTSSGKSNESE